MLSPSTPRTNRIRTLLGRALLSVLLMFTVAVTGASARDIFVHVETGSDANPGTAEAPLRTAQAAVDQAQAGDVIHLLPRGAVYRERVALIDKKGFTIEGNDCIVTGADPLPSDPAAWESVGDDLHRIRLDRTREDRHLLVVDGVAFYYDRTKFNIGRTEQIEQAQGFEAVRAVLIAQYPNPGDLEPGQFAWEPIDPRSGWLYVKGPIDNLEWSVRTDGIYTFGHTHDITIRNLHTRHVLNDGFNIHGDTQTLRLYNVSGNECLDNGISPHAACSMEVEDGEFVHNGLAIGQGHLTRTRMVRCTIGHSVHQEYMAGGGEHLLEDSTIRGDGEVVHLAYWKPNPNVSYLINEIRSAGVDPFAEVQPHYVLRRCTIEGVGDEPARFVVKAGVHLTIEGCTFTNITFEFDPEANVIIIDSTADGEALAAP
jgi:hypothetical protein